MRSLQTIVIKGLSLVVVVVVGLVVLLAVGGDEGAARTDLSGMDVTALTSASDATIYAQVDDPESRGLYRSTDGGRSWQLISQQLGRNVNALAVDPSDPRVMFAGTARTATSVQDGNLYMSTDGGQNWNKAPLSLPANAEGTVPSVLSIAADTSGADILYVGTDGQGIYKLTDKGTTMTALGDEFYGARVDQVVVTPDDSQELYAVTSKGLFRSNSAGETWKQVATLPEQVVSLAVAPSDSEILYAGTSSMGAYRSEDGGQTWHSIGQGLGLVPGVALAVTSFQVDVQNPLLVYATPSYILGTSEAHALPLGLFVSQNGGNSWRELGPDESTGQVNTLLRASSQTGDVLLGTGQGIFQANQQTIAPITAETGGPLADASGASNGVAFSKVLIILATIMAATVVVIANPVKVCRGLLGRSARTCDF